MSSTCFEPKGLYLGRRVYVQVWYIQPTSWIWTLRAETFRRHQKLKYENIDLEKVRLDGLYCIILMKLEFSGHIS